MGSIVARPAAKKRAIVKGVQMKVIMRIVWGERMRGWRGVLCACPVDNWW